MILSLNVIDLGYDKSQRIQGEGKRRG